MRAEGFPSGVEVASVMAFGSFKSARTAAANHLLNSPIGSFATNFQCKLKA